MARKNKSAASTPETSAPPPPSAVDVPFTIPVVAHVTMTDQARRGTIQMCYDGGAFTDPSTGERIEFAVPIGGGIQFTVGGVTVSVGGRELIEAIRGTAEGVQAMQAAGEEFTRKNS